MDYTVWRDIHIVKAFCATEQKFLLLASKMGNVITLISCSQIGSIKETKRVGGRISEKRGAKSYYGTFFSLCHFSSRTHSDLTRVSVIFLNVLSVCLTTAQSLMRFPFLSVEVNTYELRKAAHYCSSMSSCLASGECINGNFELQDYLSVL